jgi:8-oxo-dGTP diphosphatase
MIRVTCAIIRNEGKILAVKRPRHKHQGGKWEFPGGKIEPGESAAECIVREIFEELSVEIEICRQLTKIRHIYPDKEILLIPFLCKVKSGELILKEHEEAVWIRKDEISNPDWAAADLKIIEVNFSQFSSGEDISNWNFRKMQRHQF